MIIEILARYHGRPRPPSDPCQLNVRISWPVSVDPGMMRLDSGAVCGLFRDTVDFASSVGLRWMQGCRVCVTNLLRILLWIHGWGSSWFAFNTWCSCSYCLLAYFCTYSFFGSPRRNGFSDNQLSIRILVPLPPFFSILVWLIPMRSFLLCCTYWYNKLQ